MIPTLEYFAYGRASEEEATSCNQKKLLRSPTVCSFTLDDLRFDLLSIGALQNQIVPINCCLHWIANHKTVPDVA
jgi:hypothetical protein